MTTHPYWEPPIEFKPRKQLKPIVRTMGFQFNLPWPLPVTAGYYYGEQPVPQRREYVYSSLPEWFATDDIMPSTGGIPLMNPYTHEMRFSRDDYTVRK